MSEKKIDVQSPKLVTGNKLIPDLSQKPSDIDPNLTYWMGALPSLPVNVVHVAGVTFAHQMESPIQGVGGAMSMSTQLGVVRVMRPEHVEGVIRALPFLVVRFNPRKIMTGPERVRGAEDISGEEPVEIRTGHIVRIPTPDQEKALRAEGRFHPFLPSEFDEPLAAHIYMVKATQRGSIQPEPLSVTGLEL